MGGDQALTLLISSRRHARKRSCLTCQHRSVSLSYCAGHCRFSTAPCAPGKRAHAARLSSGARKITTGAAADESNEPAGGWDKISTDELTNWKHQGPPTPLLDSVNFPVHIKNFNAKQLQQLCKELRAGECFKHQRKREPNIKEDLLTADSITLLFVSLSVECFILDSYYHDGKGRN